MAVSGQSSHFYWPLFEGGLPVVQGHCLKEARWMQKEVWGRQKADGQFVWDSWEAIPVHKAFLMETSWPANKSIAGPALFAFVVDL